MSLYHKNLANYSYNETLTQDTNRSFEESFINRFDTFMKETYPLLEYYEKKGNLLKIKVDNITTDDIFDEIKKVIK